MNTTNITGDLGGESSEIQSQIRQQGVTADSEAYMKKHGWSQMGRIDVRQMWRVAADIIDEMENNKDCAFTWSNDRKAIIVWRTDRECPHCGSITHPPGCCAQDGHGG